MDFGLFARAADPPPSVHESVVLDRIFGNWKTRHDRVRSFHFTYDCRTTYRKGNWDLPSEPRVRLEHDQAFDQFGVQLWLDGEDRMCSLVTPSFKVPLTKRSHTRRVVARFVAAGDASYTYYSAPWWETGQPLARPFVPYGLLSRRAFPDATVPNLSFQALFLTFRSQPPWQFLNKEQCHLVDETAAIDNGYYTKFHRVLKKVGISEEALWVSPARDDVVVHWATLSGVSNSEGSIKYKKDERFGWIPSEWTCDYVGHMLEESKMTAYSINEKIDPAIFSLEFPPGTPVEDSRESKIPETIRYYVVQPGGSKRPITHDDYYRLQGTTVKKPARAKAQSK
ncbi:MAG TPA: hypothetical protein VGP63_25510 [Planctomycetaceae bacterium]|nr:hypothetical protein [Planctomycetaceae bacterium]